MIARDALAQAVTRLAQAGIEGAARDARWLLAHAMGIPSDRLTLHLGDALDADARAGFDAAIAARVRRQPVAQITRGRLFWGRRFIVTPDVLDPRPETETLVELALIAPFARVLDLGTGSGAILLTLLAERPDATGLGVDASPPALDVARANAAALGVQADLRLSDWFATVDGDFDLIVSNPPYITAPEAETLAPELAWEPRMALVPAGCDGTGLAAYRIICAQAPHHLRPGGRVLLEIGATQGAAVAALCAQAGLVDVQVHKDLSGHDRVVAARLGP